MRDASIDYCGPIRLLPFAHRPWVGDSTGSPTSASTSTTAFNPSDRSANPRHANARVESFFERLFDKPCLLTPDGRTGLSIILEALAIDRSDEVFIATTFDTPNVSSCVTCTIFNHGKPSRVMTSHTRAILVIHEFGVPHPKLAELAQEARRRGISLIEDCAHTIDSQSDGVGVGVVGDFAIASLPKVFPVAMGGIVAGAGLRYAPKHAVMQRLDTLQRDMAPLVEQLPAFRAQKREHFRKLADAFRDIGLSPLYQLDESVSPSFHFPLVTDRSDALIGAMRQADIECGRWHGTHVVVLPMHQLLTSAHLRRIIEIVRSVHAESGRFHSATIANKPRSGLEPAIAPSHEQRHRRINTEPRPQAGGITAASKGSDE